MQNEQQWFNQTLLSHKDSTQNEAFMRIAVSASTINLIDFNPPKINITISNSPISKTVSLSYDQISDLVQSFSQLKGVDIFNDNFEIVKKYYKKYFVMQFQHDINNEPVVKFSIRVSETDLAQIFVSPQLLKTIVKILNDFLSNYYLVIQTFVNQALAYQLSKMDDLKNGLRGLMNTTQSVGELPQPSEDKENIDKTEYSLDELNQFLGENMENIKIKEIDEDVIKQKGQEPPEPVESRFIQQVLKDDAMKFENIIYSYALSNVPVLDIAEYLKNELYGSSSDVNLLKGMSEKEKKSICYISKLLTSTAERAYAEYNQAIPINLPIIRYTMKDYSIENVELAYDLIIIQAFVYYYCKRLESKDGVETSDMRNIYQLRLRAYTDPLIYSVIGDSLSDAESVILKRYRYYQSQNVFERYEKILSNYHCSKIDESDIRSFIQSCVNGDQKHITEFQDLFVQNNDLITKSENDFTLEQITNEIIPLETSKILKIDLKDEEIIKDLRKKYDISDEILELFQKSKPQKKSRIRKKNNLQRMIEKEPFKDDIPEEVRDDFINYIEENQNLNFDFENSGFDLSTFGDSIIKALYCWNEFDDSKIDFRAFLANVKDCPLDKLGILAKYTKRKETSSDFSSYFEDL